jgi:hypothetical protein
LYARIQETGRFQIHDGVVIFERRSGTTRWRYKLAGARLELEESPGETYVYKRR